MVPEASNRGAFQVTTGPGAKINSHTITKPESINKTNAQSKDIIIDDKMKNDDMNKDKSKIESNKEKTSSQVNVKQDIINEVQVKSSNQKSDSNEKKLDDSELDKINNDLSLNKLPSLKLKQPQKDENDGISFIEQMRRLDEIKQEKIASLMDKNILDRNINEQELMELRRDLQPIGVAKLKPISSDGDNLNPLDKQKNRLDEIRNLINLNKKKNEDEESKIKSEDKHKEEELERRRQHFNQIKTKLKTNLTNFSNNEDKASKDA